MIRDMNTTGDSFILKTWKREMTIGDRTWIMGIINVTPDSFSDGGCFQSPEEAVESGVRMVEEGADIVDVGGESSRPGAEPVSLKEELRRVIPVIEGLVKRVTVPISVDTTKAEVAREAVASGAEIINDISAMRFDDQMPVIVAATGAAVILMHMKGTPKDMQKGDLTYRSLLPDITEFLRVRMERAKSAGVELERMMIDPGLGFGKTAEDNMKLLRYLSAFKVLGRPIVTGASRKSFIGKVIGGEPHDRLEGTAVALTVAIMNGSHVVRVHDVGAMKKVAAMADAILRA
ncbi:MAG: dihydropteroate synthase [Syntrophales bacterium]|nr:dihydropteroate synthase [Syntrophales bacterium]